jgi:hypothetical protein
MKRGLVPFCLPAFLALVGCYSYSEPPQPKDVQAVTVRNRQMAASGLDMSNSGQGAWQRSGMSGTTADVDDDEARELQLGMPELAYAEGLGGPGFGNTLPQADLDAPNEMRNSQAQGVVFRPSNHYFINGVDTGPTTDAMPGTGGPGKLKFKQAAAARELKAAESMEVRPAPGAPAAPAAPTKPVRKK